MSQTFKLQGFELPRFYCTIKCGPEFRSAKRTIEMSSIISYIKYKPKIMQLDAYGLSYMCVASLINVQNVCLYNVPSRVPPSLNES
jgi:hypothetical protein